MKIVRRTMGVMAFWLLISNLLLLASVAYIAYISGSAEGYIIGKTRGDLTSPFKTYVEHGRPFVYDQGVIYIVRKHGKEGYRIAK